MIPKDCKRLAKVDFPIAEVSKHAAREKSIRHGHPSTLHLWWARRPLASSRAVLLALLWPDPCDPLCPTAFKSEGARLTALFLWTLQATDSEGGEGAGDADAGEETPDEEDDEEGGSRRKAKGFTLVFDVVRRFAQPLGIELPKWKGHVIETKKAVVRLLPIAERAKQLFGEDGASAVAVRLEEDAKRGPASLQGLLYPETEAAPRVRGTRGRGKGAAVEVSDENLAAAREASTPDRVHAAMLLRAGNRTNALRALLKAEQDRGPDFLRLANALSALYPKGSEEKRLLDAMLLAVPRRGMADTVESAKPRSAKCCASLSSASRSGLGAMSCRPRETSGPGPTSCACSWTWTARRPKS